MLLDIAKGGNLQRAESLFELVWCENININEENGHETDNQKKYHGYPLQPA